MPRSHTCLSTGGRLFNALSSPHSFTSPKVGLINGGIGVRMSSPSPDPAGFTPGRPLFLLANDLEIDYPSITAVLLLEGEEAQFSNCYIQGAGAGAGAGAGGGAGGGVGSASFNTARNASSNVNHSLGPLGIGVGIYVGPRWTSEVMVTNSRIFGNQ